SDVARRQHATGLLRRRPARRRARPLTRGAASGDSFRRDHRLARAERSPVARMAPRRPSRRRSPTRSGYDEESGRPNLSAHRRTPDAADGTEAAGEYADAEWRDLSDGLSSSGQADS